MKRLCYLLVAGLALFAACSAPPPSSEPVNVAYTEGPAADSIQAFFDSYVKGDWSAMRSLYHDTAAVYHNASGRLTADSIVNFHKARREAYEKVEAIVHAPLAINYKVGRAAGHYWRGGWATITLTVKGTGEAVLLPMNIIWEIKGGKVVQEHAFYNSLGIFQALTKAKEAATGKK